MATTIIDYSFNDLEQISNPNGSYKAVVKGCTLITGPGMTRMGEYLNAFGFSNGVISCDVADPRINFSKFTIKLMMRVNTKVNSRQNLAESTHLPFSVYLDKDPEGGDFIVMGSVGTKAHDWSGVSTRFRKSMSKNQWYEICLAYDANTIGLFIDNDLEGVWAFPDGTIEKKSGQLLVIGTWVDKVRNPFYGDVAGFQWIAGIPEEYEMAIDDSRDHAPWHISYKYESIKNKHFLGTESNALRFDSDIKCYVQEYLNGWMLFNSAVGAFEVHGSILALYKSLPATKRKELGWLVSDEINARVNQSRKSLFRGGAIYWSPWTSATPVYGQMYIDYETLGEGLSPIGLPSQAPSAVSGGTYQKFQYGKMYYKTGAPKAYEVHGSILDRYEKLGQYNNFLGWPLSNESDVKKNNAVVGKFSEFEGGTIYWKSGIGAFEVHGSIRNKYLAYNGSIGALGFPRTNESEISNHNGPGKFNVFEGGVIVWYGSDDQTFICPPFKIHFQRIETSDEDPWPKGENDIYMHLYVYRNDAEVFHVRKPNSGDYGDHNTKEINYEIPNTFFPDSQGTTFRFQCKAWDADFIDDDDFLGDISTNLDIHNAWGQRDNNGVYINQAVSHMKITWSVLPQFDFNQFKERAWNFWSTGNPSTDKLSWAQYAAAFLDVTGDPDTLDHILSPLDYAFFKFVVEGIAKNGNCFGMSLESIYAMKNRSLFNGPLNRYTWNQIKNEVNIKHAYQVGANAIWWFVGEFLSGNTHDPKDVYTAGRSLAAIGNRPIYCLTQNYGFTGKPHSILPWKWDTPNPWKVEIYDPVNDTGSRTLALNSSTNTFSYNNNNSYSGGEWSGGRFYYMPWSVVNSVQRTPIWDAILLLLAGTIIILGDSAETTSLTNLSGDNIDGGKINSADSPRSKFFVPFHALNGNINGEFFLKKGGGIGISYNHIVKGTKNGKFEYAIKNLSMGIHIEALIQTNETHNLSIKQMGLSSGSLSLKSSVEKSFKIQYEIYLGNVTDRLLVIMENVRVLPGQDLKLVPNPGLAGIEVSGMKGTVKPKVTVEVIWEGKVSKQTFFIAASKAIRMDFSRVSFNQELKVLHMELIGGAISSIKTYRPLSS